MITLFKFLHIGALLVWCAGLLGLPLLLAKHRPEELQLDYARLRFVTHYSYVRIVTPAAVLAISFGTVLIFLRGVFVPWLFVKLVAVGGLVAIHAYIGHITLLMGERVGKYQPPGGRFLVGLSLLALLVILVLVLGKPIIAAELLPSWLLEPQDQPLPVPETPI